MKKSFIIHEDQLEILDHLTDEQAGQIFKAIRTYHEALKTEKTQSVNLGLEGLMLALFNQFKTKLDREFQEYKTKCEQNKANGKKGGRPKAKETEKTQSVNSVNSKNPKNHDSDSDSDSDSINILKNTKKDFGIFVDTLYANATIPSKCTKGKGNLGYEAYIKIEDKQKLYDDYLKHQVEEKNFAKTLANFMVDYGYHTSNIPTVNNAVDFDEMVNQDGYVSF